MKGFINFDDESASATLILKVKDHEIFIEGDESSSDKFSMFSQKYMTINEATIKVMYKNVDVSQRIFPIKKNKLANQFTPENLQYALEYCNYSELYSNAKEF